MSTLIIALPDLASPSTEPAFVRTPDGQQTGEHGTAALTQLPMADEIVALVPLACLSWHRITLPRAPAGKLRAVLDGLLEERVLDDPQALHFALAPGARAGDDTWVAACDRAWLAGWLQRLEAAGRPVDRIVPEFSPVDDALAASVDVLGPATAPLLVRSDAQGVLVLPLAGATAPADGISSLSAEPAVAAMAEQVFGSRVPLLSAHNRWVRAARTDWNLAQFDLHRTGGRHGQALGRAWHTLRTAPAWRPVRWGLVALVATQLVGLNAQAWQERRALAQRRDEARALLVQTFPQVRTVYDATLQMEREVALLRQATGQHSDRDLEPAMAAAAAALPADWSASQLEFAPGELILRGPALDPGKLQAARTRLADAGYSLRHEGERLIIQAGGGTR